MCVPPPPPVLASQPRGLQARLLLYTDAKYGPDYGALDTAVLSFNPVQQRLIAVNNFTQKNLPGRALRSMPTSTNLPVLDSP